MKRLLLGALLLSVFSAQAVKVASVTVKSADGKGDGNFGDAQSQCQVKPGDEYDPAQCARDVRALRTLGEFDDITVQVDNTVDGIEVVYVVKRKMRFQAPLVVKGGAYFNEGKIAKLSELKDGYPYGEAQIAAAAARVRRAYQKKSFPDVKVKPVVTPVDGLDGFVTITMEIEEGKQLDVKSYEFDGNESFKSSELRASFGQLPWWNPFGWFNDAPATAQDLAEARDKVATFYRDHGYLDVEVGEPKLVERQDGKLDRVFDIKEGPKYTVGELSISGVKTYAPDVVLASVKSIKKGDVAGQSALDEAAHEIEVYCGSGTNALAETQVAVRRIQQAGSPQTLDLEFVVKEGVPVQIDHIVVRGNDYTKTKVITREVPLSPGDPMLADKADQGKQKLESLRYFERVRYYLEKTDDGRQPVVGEPEKRDLVYEVAERNTGNFLIGIGAGSESSVFGQVEINEANFDLFSPWRFRGDGQKGRICVQAGPRIQTYEASISEPYFFDRQLEFTVEVYRRQRWFDDYDVIRNGAMVELNYPVKFLPTAEAFGRLGFSVSMEMIQMDDVDGIKLWDPKRGDRFRMLREEEDRYGDNWEVPFEVFWRHDTRDRFMFPTSGHNAKIYGDVVVGDNNYWRVGFNYRQYLPVPGLKKYGHVFMFGIRGVTIDDFSDDIPIYDRLFLGGSKNIRGVDFREIAPRMYAREHKRGRYVPWGGQTSWCANMEYSMPIVSVLRFAAFSDLGSVGADEFDFDTDWFCWSVGVGIRIDLESFPIRLDFAVPVVDPDEDVDEKVFSFSVGYDF